MHKNILSFWQYLETLPKDHPDTLSPRVCILLQETFEKWQTRPKWLSFGQMGHLFDHYSQSDLPRIVALSVAERKGLAIKKMFTMICDEGNREKHGTMEINPNEIIIGTLPPYSVGQGKELMKYLTVEESLYWELRYLNEWSPFGHIVPDHEALLTKGILGIIQECQEKKAHVETEIKKSQFYDSVISSLEGVLYYINAYADLALATAQQYNKEDIRAKKMTDISLRLREYPAKPCETFMDALQAIFIMHCALHFTGEIVPIGRLDQLLHPYYRNDLAKGLITKEQAQEALDCFWIKLDEKVVLNRRFVEDRFTSSDGALLGSGGPSNFDQGALINQWMQQVTIGGTIANNDELAADAANDITFMCLEAARRLPLNSPTLDLRVHKGTADELLDLAARTVLSGGAHPILMNDDKIIPALQYKTGGTVELKSARNYACDGCYETLFAGETEFSFGFVGALDILEKTLNSGAGFGASGATYLRGSKAGLRTKQAQNIQTYHEFWEIFEQQLLLGCHRFFHGILSAYGIKENVSPSPLLSAMINGCIGKGRDLAGGGARYHLFSPLMTGVSTAVDSLWVIKQLVYTEQLFTLQELVSCLRTNWGRNKEVQGLKISEERITEIRAACIRQPKFGQGIKAIDEIAYQLIDTFYNSLQDARNGSVHQQDWKRLAEVYKNEGEDFEILIAPGIGTFEQYNFSGSFIGATPDGRFAFDPISSDLSPAPHHSDQPIPQNPEVRFMDGLSSYRSEALELLSDGAIPDFNIKEDFSLKELSSIFKSFAKGHGGNMLTVTVSDPETFSNAQISPDDYNLVRVRMGGWSEFFISLFPTLQEQHKRRPLFKE
ncbi:pyruvate formate lyase family protein [Pedobacter psychrodurus]|uniref:pyruvate formate lyase family protein n=1 Tax=Pedobacter psychrodurus TaxID=2530456 RepID=UPI00292D0955|nr:pyruvate formate lyase family protein [Pedobacter psychrodurus]